MIALQLYTVRDALSANFEGTIRQIAAYGYPAVETAGVYGESPAKAKALFDELGLKVTSAHSPLPLGDNQQKVLDTIGALGAKTIVFPWIAAENFEALDRIQRLADQLNAADAVAREHGLSLAYHNHDFELRRLPDGSLPLLRLKELVAPTVLFEVDTYWVQTGGANVIEVLQALGPQAAQLMHVKDGPCVVGQPMTAVGDGVMNFREIFAAFPAEYHIVEADRVDGDPLAAVDKSFRYLSNL
ncbi:MAG: sugar phosphate isomerase/epimerase [Anaerolineae bacterium]|nr:sugar phosphate isomerase/epimerase [Anaerolineae bacterium]